MTLLRKRHVDGMNDTLKLIVGLLEGGKPELQVAAAQILGELRAKDGAVVKALQGGLRRSPVLARFCLDALAKVQTPEALAVVADLLVEADPLADHAAQLLADVGGGAHAALVARFPDAPAEAAHRILAVLARAPGKEGVPVFVRALLTPDLSSTAVRILLGGAGAPGFGKALREGLAKHLDDALPESCLGNVITVLARLDRDGAKSLLHRYTQDTCPPSVRSAAFRALAGTSLSAPQLRHLLDLLEDPAQKDVHEAVRELLASLPEVPEGALPVLKRLLQARQPEQRLFALRMLRTAGGADLAKFALKWIDHEDERFRTAAVEALSCNPKAADLVLRLLITTRLPAVAETAASILLRLAPQLPTKFVRGLAERAIRTLGSQPRLCDQLLDVALAVPAAKVVPLLVESCVRLRRAGRRAEALHVLARLVSSPQGDAEVRYQLALTKLLHDAAQGAEESEAPGNPTMGFFVALVREGFPLFERLRKENAVTPELLLRLAMHFANSVGAERRFGTELLQHLATRTRGRAGDEAKVALRAVGG